MPFSKILIANRGEIACRIARTAHALGYCSVAVFSDADADAPHVKLAHEAVRIGPAPARQSYLDIDAVLAAAKLSGADAVHPGYGFLAENAEFAERCEHAGLVFIGPSPYAIRVMGNKAAAKRLMIKAKVPCIPGYEGDQSNETLTAQARRIGFPIMVKAAAGGGGRGVRLVAEPAEFSRALAAARSEALNAFGSDELILEKAIADARHVEIQILADAHGNFVHLGERDCSIQRRHQKVIEEAPSPAISEKLRAQMGEAAVAAARVIDYRGAGTIEFLLDQSGNFHFLEMNTRLQVEHSVTEAITGLDLVAWQLRVAAGETLPSQDRIRFEGHAIEARLYAEDPYADFLPSSGTILDWRPASGEGVRIDHGLEAGQDVSPFYDPLLAKVIGSGKTREEARRRLVTALAHTVVLGIDTNRGFLVSVLECPVFIGGEATTAFIDRYFKEIARRPELEAHTVALAAALLFESSTTRQGSTLANWSSTGALAWPLRLIAGEAWFAVEVTPTGPGRCAVALGGQTIAIEILKRSPGQLRFSVGGRQQCAHFALADRVLHLDLAGVTATFREITLEPAKAGRKQGGSRLLAPMNGAIIAVLAQPGDPVRKGQRIIVLEAMKMQHEVAAERDGILERIHVKQGDQVATRQLLAELTQESGTSNQEPGARKGRREVETDVTTGKTKPS